MAIRRYKPEQIVSLLRQIEGVIANGKTTTQACKEAGAISKMRGQNFDGDNAI